MMSKQAQKKEKRTQEQGSRSSLPMRVMKYVVALVLVVVLIYFGFTAEAGVFECIGLCKFKDLIDDFIQAVCDLV